MNELFILDFGSGNTCRNDKATIKKMIDELVKVLTAFDIPEKLDEEGKKDRLSGFVIKWQLFKNAGKNAFLTKESFTYAYNYAEQFGLQTTASVFDKGSLDFLLKFDIPFVKFSCGGDTIYPIKLQIIKSETNSEVLPSLNVTKMSGPTNEILSVYSFDGFNWTRNDRYLSCIKDYPAKAKDYKKRFSKEQLGSGISDHTTTWALFKQFAPKIYECHYKLPESKGLDAGPFARTPKQIKELLNDCV